MKNFEMFQEIFRAVFCSHLIIDLIIIAIAMDSIFGCVRSFKKRNTNSSIGIDGIMRKASMIASLLFFLLIDYVLNINLMDVLVKIVPEKTFEYIPIKNAGLTELFGLMYLAYESMSVLKNMNACNLPVKRIWILCDTFLRKYTDELPDATLEEDVKKIADRLDAISRSLNIKEEDKE